jgi:hypothetical protein
VIDNKLCIKPPLIYLLITVSLSSCTYFSPSINLVKVDPKKNCAITEPGCNLPSLYRATESLETSLDQLEKKRNWSLSTNRALGAATFGLGVVAVANGIHSGHSNAIKNASLGAGVVYLSSTLFTPISQTQSYQSGLVALTCIQDKAKLSLAIAGSAFKELEDADKEACDRNDNVILASQSAHIVASYAKNNDAFMANSVTSGANLIVNEINNQMITQTPNPAAFYEAARNVGQLPPFVKAQTSTAAQKLFQNTVRTGVTCKSDYATDTAGYKSIEDRFKQAINELDRLGEKCTLASANVESLSVSVESYEITKNSGIHQINISGGRKPYYQTQNRTFDGLKVQIGTDTLIISAGENLTATGDVIVTVKDSSLIQQSKQIKLTVK